MRRLPPLRFPRLRVSFLLAGILAAGIHSHGLADDLLTEARFNLAILEPISATVPRTEVRTFLQRISAERNIAIVFDCRVDPHQLRDIAWVELGLISAIDELADDIDASTSIVGDTFLIGPRDSLQNLRTLVALRLEELEELEELAGVDTRHAARLRRRAELTWQDLDRPGDLLHSIAAAYGMRIENPEQIPHDLWAGATIANANAVEQLSIVLMQLDLAFAWSDDGTSITLVPYPAEAAIERQHQPRGMTIAEAEAAARGEFPELPIEAVGRALSVTARIEEHERIEELLGIRQPREITTQEVPLARRTFTLTVINQPVEGVIQALIDQGVPIEFDAEQLTNAGADLAARVSLQLRDVRIEALMEELCAPAGLQYEVDGERVLLRVSCE